MLQRYLFLPLLLSRASYNIRVCSLSRFHFASLAYYRHTEFFVAISRAPIVTAGFADCTIVGQRCVIGYVPIDLCRLHKILIGVPMALPMYDDN